MLTNQSISMLSRIFEIDYSGNAQDSLLTNEEVFLNTLQDKINMLLNEHSEEYFINIDGIEEIQKALVSFTYSKLVSITHGIDYNLELRNKVPYVTQNKYSVILHCLLTLPKKSGEGLKGENHGHGYHIHYVIINKSKEKRTDVLLTFNPKEIKSDNDTLYWETHGGGISKHPDKFGKRRRMAIYSSSCTFLSKIKKSEFKRPGAKSEKLWPQ